MATAKHAKGIPAVWHLRLGKLKGFSSYRYVFDGRGPWDGITVLVAPPDGEAKPWRWYVMVRAERLWRSWFAGHRVAQVVRDVTAGLANHETGAGIMGRSVPLDAWKVARIDVCRDHGGKNWEVEDLTRFATRSPRWSRGVSLSKDHGAEEIEPEHEPQDPTAAVEMADEDPEDKVIWTYGNRGGMTLYRGRRSAMCRMLRIYRKDVQAEAKGTSVWLVPFWRWAFLGDASAHGPLPPIWRAEVEFGGGWLRAHGFTSAACLDDCEEALWSYYTDAVRHTNGKPGDQLRHLPPSRTWAMLSKVPRQLAPAAWIYEPAAPITGERDMAHLTKMAAGCLARVIEDAYRPNTEEELEAALVDALAKVRERTQAKARGYCQTAQSSPEPRAPKVGSKPTPGTPWTKPHPWDGEAPRPRPCRADRLLADPAQDSDPFA